MKAKVVTFSPVSAESEERAEDLFSIVTVFVVRHNNNRHSAANRKRRQEAQFQNFQDTGRQNTAYPSLSYERREIETHGEVDALLQSKVVKKSTKSKMPQRRKLQQYRS